MAADLIRDHTGLWCVVHGFCVYGDIKLLLFSTRHPCSGTIRQVLVNAAPALINRLRGASKYSLGIYLAHAHALTQTVLHLDGPDIKERLLEPPPNMNSVKYSEKLEKTS